MSFAVLSWQWMGTKVFRFSCRDSLIGGDLIAKLTRNSTVKHNYVNRS